MDYPVIVRAEAADGYVAQPLGLPELRVAAASADEAVTAVRLALERWLSTARLVYVSVAIDRTENPWLDGFGRSAADPDFDEYEEELRKGRLTDP